MFSIKVDDKNPIESSLISRIQIEFKSFNNINRCKNDHNIINNNLNFIIYDERMDQKCWMNDQQL